MNLPSSPRGIIRFVGVWKQRFWTRGFFEFRTQTSRVHMPWAENLSVHLLFHCSRSSWKIHESPLYFYLPFNYLSSCRNILIAPVIIDHSAITAGSTFPRQDELLSERRGLNKQNRSYIQFRDNKAGLLVLTGLTAHTVGAKGGTLDDIQTTTK